MDEVKEFPERLRRGLGQLPWPRIHRVLLLAPHGLPWLEQTLAALRRSLNPSLQITLLAEEGRQGDAAQRPGCKAWTFRRSGSGRIKDWFSLYRRIAHERFDLVAYFTNRPLQDPLEAFRLQLIPAKQRLLVNPSSGACLFLRMETFLRIVLTHPGSWIRHAARFFLRFLYRTVWDPIGHSLWRLMPLILEPLFRLAGRRRGASLEEARKILFIALDNPGDVLLTTPVLSALKERFPWATLMVLAGEWSSELLESHPVVDKVIRYNAPWFSPYVRHLPHSRMRPVRDLARCLKTLWHERFDMTVETRGEAAHAALGYLTGAWVRAGYCLRSVVPWLRADHVAHLLTHRVPYAWDRWERGHRVDYNLQVAIHLGATPKDPSLVLPIPIQARQRMQRLLEAHGVREDALLVGVHPGASRERKRWPADRFAEVLDHLTERWGARVVVMGSFQERALAEELYRLMARPPILAAGETTLLGAAALIERCRLLICNDSVMTHLASAVKTPVVSLSRSPANFYAPYRTEGIALTHRLSCMNRGLPDGCNCPFSEYWCLQEVTAGEALTAAEALLERSANAHADRH